VSIGLTLLAAAFNHINDVFFWSGFWNDAEFSAFYEFDHVRAVDKKHVVWLISRKEAFIKVGELIDEGAELLVGFESPRSASDYFFC
jgi:hypothetical protein